MATEIVLKITDPLYLPLKRGGPVCPPLESPRRVLPCLITPCQSAFQQGVKLPLSFRRDGREVR